MVNRVASVLGVEHNEVVSQSKREVGDIHRIITCVLSVSPLSVNSCLARLEDMLPATCRTSS